MRCARFVVPLLATLVTLGCATEEGPVDADGDGVDAGIDCNDNDSAVFPDAEELCNGVDDNCNGLVDDAATDAQPFHRDGDGDRFGQFGDTVEACEAPVGFVDNAEDCDDNRDDVYPGAREDDCTDPTDYNCDGSVGYSDADNDGFAACTDCDDALPGINPAAQESCDERDNDCDGETDEAGAAGEQVWFGDKDGDGFGDPLDTRLACDQPAAHVGDGTDCNDASDAVFPGGIEVCDDLDNDCDGRIDVEATDASTWFVDVDGDGFGVAAVQLTACDQPTGFAAVSGDCDDSRTTANPDATEVCDDVDNDCDATVDEGFDKTWHADSDGDGFGSATARTEACTQPTGFVRDSTDCNDAASVAYPGATEVCDRLDNDCDTLTDEDVTTTYFGDGDGDGYGNKAVQTEACSQPRGFVTDDTDCDDGDDDAFPGNTEVCDTVDNDCDGSTDEDVTTTYYGDGDGDGYGTDSLTREACSRPAGYADNDEDCDDGDEDINPDETEVCDDDDNDCDGVVDEEFTKTWYLDADGDDYGTNSVTVTSCTAPSKFVEDDGDCDDSDDDVNPDATQVCNGIDDDCTGLPSDEEDDDSDGYLVCEDDCDDTDDEINPGATEIWYDGVDQDCDGESDDDQDGDGEDWVGAGGKDLNDEDPSCTDDCQDGSTQSTAGDSCQQLYDDYSIATGEYWIDPDQDGNTADAYRVVCETDTDVGNGAWTLSVRVSNNDTDRSWHNIPSFINSTLINSADADDTTKDWKGQSYNEVAGREVLAVGPDGPMVRATCNGSALTMFSYFNGSYRNCSSVTVLDSSPSSFGSYPVRQMGFWVNEPSCTSTSWPGDDCTLWSADHNGSSDLGSCWNSSRSTVAFGCAESSDTSQAQGYDIGYASSSVFIELYVR